MRFRKLLPGRWLRARWLDRANLALAVTGFAGPAGEDREEGLVHFALAQRDRETVHREEHFGPIGRGPVRVESLKAMLETLEDAIKA